MNVIGRQCLQIFKSSSVQQNHFCILRRSLAYESAFSLKNIYPKSNLNLYTPTFTPEDPNAKFNGYLPIEKLEISYSRSSGPGGQHVNRTNTKVDVRFHVKTATWLSEEIREKLFEKYKTKINKKGQLIIGSELTRSQQLNLADALQKLRTMIRNAIEPTPEISPETAEMLRKRKLAAARKRLFEKRKHSQIKRDRNSSVDF